MGQDQKSEKSGKSLAIALQVLVGLIMGLGGAAVAITHDHHKGLWLALAWVAVSVGAYLAVFIHELGHVVAGLQAGMEFRQMHVGPLGVSRSAGKTEVFLNRRKNSGGFAYMLLPETGDPTTKLQQFIRGGPVSSLLFSSLLAALFLAALSLDFEIATISFGGMLLGSLLTVSGTVIPFYSRGMETDALVLKKLSEPGPQRDFVVANFLLSKEMSAGIRARAWTESAITTLLASSVNPIQRFRASYIAYSYYHDKGDTEQERLFFRQAEDLVKANSANLGMMAHAFWLQKALVLADSDSDYAGAKLMLANATMKAEILEFSRLVAEAAIEVGEGNSAGSEEKLNKAVDALQRLRRRTGCNIEEGTETIARLRNRAGLGSSST